MSVPFPREVPPLVRAAQIFGITTAAALAGANFSASFLGATTILEAPAPVAAKQWKKFYESGRAFAIPGSVAVASVFGFLAYRERTINTHTSTLYTLSALLLPASIPYTALVMLPTIRALLDKADTFAASSGSKDNANDEEAGVAREETTHGLIDRWATLNLGRTALMTAGAVVAAWATVAGTEVARLGVRDVGIVSGADRLG